MYVYDYIYTENTMKYLNSQNINASKCSQRFKNTISNKKISGSMRGGGFN